MKEKNEIVEHPEPDLIRKFATGLLPEEENEKLGKHLLFCTSCREHVSPSAGIRVFKDALKKIEEMKKYNLN